MTVVPLLIFWKSVPIFVNASVSDAAADTVIEPVSFAGFALAAVAGAAVATAASAIDVTKTATHRMTIAQEEIFGPVLSILPYDTEEEAVEIANDTVYGLAGGVWSGDPERAKKVALQLRTGQVEVNGGGFNLMAPFGGYKQSGHGRGLGKYGLEEYLEVKSLQL